MKKNIELLNKISLILDVGQDDVRKQYRNLKLLEFDKNPIPKIYISSIENIQDQKYGSAFYESHELIKNILDIFLMKCHNENISLKNILKIQPHIDKNKYNYLIQCIFEYMASSGFFGNAIE